jgi:hypothetical protein
MNDSDVRRAVAAASSIVAALGLPVEVASTLHNSNKLTLHLLPCDVVARVAHSGHAQFEVNLAQRLTEAGGPIAVLEPRAEPRVYERDGFAVTLWTYHESLSTDVAPADYAAALSRLHAGMREIDLPTPHFTDRVAEAQQLVSSRDQTPALADADRELLSDTLRRVRSAITSRSATEQLLHGEPHPGNVLNTAYGPLFIDLETCCRGPIEFDLAHVPDEVSDLYPNVDKALLHECRILTLAMVAAWRWDKDDQFPNGRQMGLDLLDQIRSASGTID